MFGVQLRSPATDPRIVEFCLSLPEDQFLRNGTPRWLIRRAMQGKLPDEILRNSLRGQQSAAWLEQFCLAGNRMDEELHQLDRSPLARLVIDLPRLRNLLSRLRGATDRNSAEAGWLRDMIGTALMTGRFLRWTEGAA
jgi:asparagine synthase (glutamine-hydrolysing)